MFSERLLDHFENPRNVGELPAPAVAVEVSNPACGDILRLTARIEAGRIAEVRYKVRGCTASIAAGSALTEMMNGRDRRELAASTARRLNPQWAAWRRNRATPRFCVRMRSRRC